MAVWVPGAHVGVLESKAVLCFVAQMETTTCSKNQFDDWMSQVGDFPQLKHIIYIYMTKFVTLST